MSVLRSQRNLAKTEFEHTFAALYKFSAEQTRRIPKRRQRWLAYNIDSCMNQIYRSVMLVNETYFKNKPERTAYAANAAKDSISNLNALKKPLIVMWNVQETKTKTMVQWVTLIRKEVELLNKMHRDEDMDCDVIILDWYAINKATFLKKMSELHRYTHGKVTGACKTYDNTEGALLISIVDDAFYELVLANEKIPTTKAEYEERSTHISAAITSLQMMNRPMLSFYNLMHYSERIMKEWSSLLTEEIKLLYGLRKSDKERFKNLQ